MKREHYVYKTTDEVNGEFYIGVRTSKGCSAVEDTAYSGSFISWQPDNDHKNLNKEVLCTFPTRELADEFEIELISENITDPLNRNYYIPTKGFNIYGNEEAAKKISKHMTKWHKEVGFSEEAIERIRQSRLGTTWSEEQREKMRDYRRNNPNPQLGKTGKYAPFYGRKHTVETKKKISDALTGRHLTDEHKKSLSEAANKRDQSPYRTKEFREKMSNRSKGSKNPSARKVQHIESGKIFSHMKEAAVQLGVHWTTVSGHCRGERANQKFKYV